MKLFTLFFMSFLVFNNGSDIDNCSTMEDKRNTIESYLLFADLEITHEQIYTFVDHLVFNKEGEISGGSINMFREESEEAYKALQLTIEEALESTNAPRTRCMKWNSKSVYNQTTRSTTCMTSRYSFCYYPCSRPRGDSTIR